MNKKELIRTTFLVLLNQGETTTLDVKNKLREQYPEESWTQKYISECCSQIYSELPYIDFKDNGTYREYYLVGSEQTPLMYSFTTKRGQGVTLFAKDPETIVEAARELGELIHYSKSKDTFMYLSEMNPQHLYNAIRIDLDEKVHNPTELISYLNNSPLIDTLSGYY